MSYFLKELIKASPINLSSGVKLSWDLVANDTGVLATEDEAVANELRVLIKERRGGVLEIGAEKYETLKKNPKFTPVRTQSILTQQYKLIDRNQNPMDPAQPATDQANAPVAAVAPVIPAAVQVEADAVKAAPLKLKTKRASRIASPDTVPVAG